MSLQDDIFDVANALRKKTDLVRDSFDNILSYLNEVEAEKDILKDENNTMKKMISIKKKEK